MTATTENIDTTLLSATSTLPIMEHFYTIQGEGFYQGHAAYFIRLGGCDVGCVWCDVKESWDADAHPHFSIQQLVDEVKATPSKIVVITGGEPLMHPLDALTNALHAAGLQTNIETSGSSALSGNWDWLCLSPKKFKAPLPEVIEAANELKVIIYHKSDFAFGEQFAAQVPADCKLYLQPEWSKADVMVPLIVEYVKANPKWELSLQLHKYINVP